MDAKHTKPMCWEITGCGRVEDCKVVQLVKTSGKPCWEVVVAFDDYRSALNVCGDCIVSVLSRHHSLSPAEINALTENEKGTSAHHACPGLLIS